MKPAIAIFGGSFDPPHLGHQQIVEKAIQTLDIEKLLVVPAYLNPFKTSSLASAQMRLNWCRELFDDIPNIIVNDYEIKEGKSTVTSQTVKHLNQTYLVKYLIIGADNLSTLTQWHAFEWLNETITWVIVTREDHRLDTDVLKKWKLLSIAFPVSSTQIREEKDLQYIDTKIQDSVRELLQGKHI